MKKILFFLASLFLLNHIVAQNSLDQGLNNPTSFYLRIPNRANIPVILSKSKEKGVSLRHINSKVQSIFNKYKVNEFIQAFPTAKTPYLREIYLVKANEIDLMNELRTKFPGIYTFSENIGEGPQALSLEYNYNFSPFILPNDYGLELSQTDMDLINAQKAWSFTTGDPNTKLGIVDTEFNISHPELSGKINSIGNNGGYHGTSVAMNMAGKTNNGIGLSSIGYNCHIEARTGLTINNCLVLSQMGVKIINGSWLSSCNYSQIEQDVINEITSNGTILVFAAGNTTNCGGNSNVVYPAAYDNVIAVTSIHHKDFMQPAFNEAGNYIGDVLRRKDTHDNSWVYQQRKDGSHNHTYVVDIAAPGYEVPSIGFQSSGYSLVNGTSNAAPMVAGTIGLMKSVNNRITTTEIESILKLTSANIYQIPENANYIDKLGAGRLDAGKAVEMAYKMNQSKSFIEINNRHFYRNWKFEIKNAPYGIKVNNEKFTDSIKVNLTAKKYIEIENSTIEPNSIGGIELSVEETPILIPIENNLVLKNKTNNSHFFLNKTLFLDYSVINGIKTEHSNSELHSFTPSIRISLNKKTNEIYADLIGYCNTSSSVYKLHSNHLEALNRGITSLNKCSIQENNYFNSLTGDVYIQKPSKKINYQINQEGNGIWIWSNDNYRMFFSTTPRYNSNNLNRIISVFPNPTNELINISVNSDEFQVSDITIFDISGKMILKKRNNSNVINVSNLSPGIYFLELKTSNDILFTKKIVKN
ncbi:S8 family serine peptidase [Tenacibaculum sp. 190524A05c]|uniref:S8 family serine peptidase n=1 Tax=Tenacibaculum platacis TaxID=3137852 RepID=UPI0032B2343D